MDELPFLCYYIVMAEQIPLRKTYKYRLYPTRNQQEILERHLSFCRWLYNLFLEEKRTSYEKDKTRITCFDQIKEIPKLKKEKPGLKKVYSQTLQDVVRRLDKSFQNFFRRIKENKNGKKQKVGYPRFKGYWRYDTLIYPQSGFKLKDNKLNLSKIGFLRIKLHREIEGTPKTLTIRRTNTNKWYVCFAVEINKALPEKKEIKQVIGIDVGLDSFLTTNQGEKVNNPRYLIQSKEKLSQIQRWHSRKKLKSSNRSKSRLRLAKLHEKITNQRQDFLHKLSNRLIKSFQLIAFEKLDINGMLKNRYLARSISDASWNKFLQMLSYKAAEAGARAVGVNPKNTSQTCSGCNHLVKKTLSQKRHKCPNCGLTIDRDVNAARNILNLALTTVGTTGSNACGVERLPLTMKQEAIGFNRW